MKFLPSEEELPELQAIVNRILINENWFKSRFVAESPEKLQQVYLYYAAFYKLNAFPFKKCNAPWVSTVVEADGDVRPCFFHDTIGNIHTTSLQDILNSDKATAFRKALNTGTDVTCKKCVCSLNLSPFAKIE